MDTAETFIAAIAADVDNNVPRLAFADWLDENGQPERAEFIRLHCGPFDDNAIRERAAKLMAAHGAEWDASLQPLGAKTWYFRGFPHVIQVDFKRLVENQSLLSIAPDWHLVLSRAGRDYRSEPEIDLCDHLATGPFADRISGLNLAHAGWDIEELEALFVPPLINRLRELRIGDVDTGLDIIDLLAQQKLRLKELVFAGDSEGGIGDEGCQILASRPAFGSLRLLELTNNGLGPEAAKSLANSPYLTQLENLDLEGGSNSTNRIGPQGAIAIASSTNFRRLTSLNLMFNFIHDDGFSAIVRSPNLPELTSLNMPGNDITDAGVRALAASTALPKLSWLNVSAGRHGTISAQGIQALVASPRMTRLTGLGLSGNPIGNEGAFALADLPNCSNLTELRVSDCSIGVTGFTRMLESPHLAGVKEFALFRNPVSAKEKQELSAKYPHRVK